VRQSGSQVFRELRQALDRARDDAAALRRESQTFDSQIAALVNERTSSFAMLARLYLPSLTRSTAANTFDAFRTDLEGLLARKEQSQREVAGRLERLNSERQGTVAELKEVTNRLNEKVQERETLQARLATLLKEDPSFQSLSNRALMNEAELKRNEERVHEIEQDSQEKLPAYERSRLFRYLHGRKFGTPDYDAEGIVRRLDRWVARLIGYERARQSYAFLTTTPHRMRDEVERRRGEFNQLMAQVEDLERQAADAIGLTPVLAEGDRLGKERDTLVARSNDVLQRIGRAEHERAQLDQDQGTFYAEALGRFQNFLAKAETAVLERRARSTPDRADDDLVSRIRWIGDEIGQLQPQVADLAARSKGADEVSDGLDFVVRRYQQSNYDSDRSYFDGGSDLTVLVARFLSGAISRDQLWQQIRQEQKFEPTWAETNAGSVVNHPLTGVLLHAMVEVAGAALQQSAQRSVSRRHSGGSSPSWGGGIGGGVGGGGMSFPTVNFPQSSGGGGGGSVSGGSSSGGASLGGGPSDGGFTSGEGF